MVFVCTSYAYSRITNLLKIPACGCSDSSDDDGLGRHNGTDDRVGNQTVGICVRLLFRIWDLVDGKALSDLSDASERRSSSYS